MIKVKAAEGVRVPYEDSPHRYIEQEVVEVDNSLYYQRRIADGDLIVVEQAAESKPKNAKNEKERE